MTSNNSAVIGTAGGTFLSVLPNIHTADVLRTVILATIGAVVSFFISMTLKWLIRKLNAAFLNAEDTYKS